MDNENRFLIVKDSPDGSAATLVFYASAYSDAMRWARQQSREQGGRWYVAIVSEYIGGETIQ